MNLILRAVTSNNKTIVIVCTSVYITKTFCWNEPSFSRCLINVYIRFKWSPSYIFQLNIQPTLLHRNLTHKRNSVHWFYFIFPMLHIAFHSIIFKWTSTKYISLDPKSRFTSYHPYKREPLSIFNQFELKYVVWSWIILAWLIVQETWLKYIYEVPQCDALNRTQNRLGLRPPIWTFFHKGRNGGERLRDSYKQVLWELWV